LENRQIPEDDADAVVIKTQSKSTRKKGKKLKSSRTFCQHDRRKWDIYYRNQSACIKEVVMYGQCLLQGKIWSIGMSLIGVMPEIDGGIM
jgi:hypothetical protein